METDEVLETGYGRRTPHGDNLCNDYVAGMAEGFVALGRARGDRVDDGDPDMAMADGASPSQFGNVVIVRRPIDGSEWPAVAERMHQFFGGRDGAGFVVSSAWPTPDLGGRGFGRIGHPPLMFRPAGPVADAPVDGLQLCPVDDAATARDWELAFVRGYPEPAFEPFQAGCLLPHDALAAPRWQHWVGYLHGAPVATASAYTGDHHVEVEFVSTVPEARGRGIGRAATAVATLAAPERPAMLLSSDDGRGVYERLGYLPMLRFTLWAAHRR
jgi:ribosomal protein S18 acetylase RimI-like enzyme